MNSIVNAISSTHIGSFYCALIASEAAVRTVIFTACGIINAVKTVFEGTLERSEFNRAARYFEIAGRDAFNTATYGIGALNPVAGVIVPAVSFVSNLRQDVVSRGYILGAMVVPPETRIDRYWIPRAIEWVPVRIVNGIYSQFETYLPFTSERLHYQILTAAMIGLGFFALGVSPFASLSTYKFFPIRLTIG